MGSGVPGVPVSRTDARGDAHPCLVGHGSKLREGAFGVVCSVVSRDWPYAAVQYPSLAAAAEDGRITGALSARDLLRLRADAAVVLGDDIDEARDVPALARAWAKVPAMAESLLAEGVSARDIAGIVARELGALTRRAGALAEEQLAQEGAGSVSAPGLSRSRPYGA